MNGWLLDTNVIAEIGRAKPDAKVAAWFGSQPERTLFLSILTFGEYQKGIEHLLPGDARRPNLQRALIALETRFSGRILPVSDPIVLRWGAISGEVKRLTGHSPSVTDTLLAATAIEHDLYLATRNTSDVSNSGAVVFNPWEDDPDQFPLRGPARIGNKVTEIYGIQREEGGYAYMTLPRETIEQLDLIAARLGTSRDAALGFILDHEIPRMMREANVTREDKET